MEIVKKKDFVELKYTGYANGKIFDSNIEEDLKVLDAKAKPREIIIIVGESMILPGLDRAIEEKEIGKEYEITLSPKEAFGERKTSFVKTVALKAFTEKKVNPYPGMVLALDNTMAKVIAVSGARVLIDLNNPLAGKEVKYKYQTIRKVDDEKERVKVVIELLLRFVPEFEIKEKEVIVKGPKVLESYLKIAGEKFKELIGKELRFEEKEIKEKKSEKEENKPTDNSS